MMGRCIFFPPLLKSFLKIKRVGTAINATVVILPLDHHSGLLNYANETLAPGTDPF